MLNNKTISYQLSAIISGQQTGKPLQTSLLRKLFTIHCSLFTNKRGLSLVEVMIALVILLLVFLALMQTALVSIDSNMINVLRDEAVGIAEMRMNDARNTPFDSISAPSGDVYRNIRNITNFKYSVSGTVTSAGTNAKQVSITVTWEWKEKTVANGNPYTHTISTILRRQ